MNRDNVLKLGVAAAVATGAMLLASPPASASPMSYLDALNANGMTVYDASAAVSYGYAICRELNTATGDVVAARVFISTSWADVPDVATAAMLVVTAVEELCPWHDHRGGQLA